MTQIKKCQPIGRRLAMARFSRGGGLISLVIIATNEKIVKQLTRLLHWQGEVIYWLTQVQKLAGGGLC